MFTFIETRLFTRLVGEYLSDDEYRELQAALIRKLRWGLAGRGKRGGLRVIYYLRDRKGVIWMLTLHPKSVAENIPTHVLRKIREEMEDV